MGIGLLAFVLFVRAETTHLRIATYNLRNYLEVNRWVDGSYRPNYPKPEMEKTALRKALIEVGPDILILQEMGPEPFLLELQRDLRREGLVLPHAYLARGSDKERHLALLSKFKPVSLRTHENVEFEYFGETIPVKRGILEAVFQHGMWRWKVYGLHLKSRWTEVADDPLSAQRRRSEALAVRKRIMQRHREDRVPYILAGDFNDVRSNSPIRLLQNRGKTQVAKLVECLDSRGEVWTYFYAKEETYSRVDYILMSPDFPALVKNGHGHIFDGAGSLGGSDHRLVWLDLELGRSAVENG